MSYLTLVIAEILTERGNQYSKWGEQNHSAEKWLLILMEELGETAQAVLDGAPTVRDELIQVAAVAVAWLEAMEREL